LGFASPESLDPWYALGNRRRDRHRYIGNIGIGGDSVARVRDDVVMDETHERIIGHDK
jgi:hypothetical protein